MGFQTPRPHREVNRERKKQAGVQKLLSPDISAQNDKILDLEHSALGSKQWIPLLDPQNRLKHKAEDKHLCTQ